MADFVVGDSNSSLVATLFRRNGSLYDLTGKTIKLKYRIGITSYSEKTMTILTPSTSGQVRYLFAAVDLANEGNMYAEVEILDGALVVSSAEVGIFGVRGKTI